MSNKTNSKSAAKANLTASEALESSLAPTDKINRTKFTSKSVYKFVEFFKVLSTNQSNSPMFVESSPTPEEMRAIYQNLKNLKDIATTVRSAANRTALASAVNAAKAETVKLAEWTETTYPRSIQAAATIAMEYDRKPRNSVPAPTKAVTDLKLIWNAGELTVKWKPLSGMSGLVRYHLYARRIGVADSKFYLVSISSNSRRGMKMDTEVGAQYQIYIQAETTGGGSPQSDPLIFVGQM